MTESNTTETESNRTDNANFKSRPMKFSSLQKFLLFENVGTTRNEAFVLGVTIVNETKIRFNVKYRARDLNVGFSFYLIDFIPWIQDAADAIEKNDNFKAIAFSSSMPEAYVQPGKASHCTITLSQDDKGCYLETLFKGVDPIIKVVRFRFNPIPGTSNFIDGQIHEQKARVRLTAWLRQLARTSDTVSSYISAINANEWTPPVASDMVG